MKGVEYISDNDVEGKYHPTLEEATMEVRELLPFLNMLRPCSKMSSRKSSSSLSSDSNATMPFPFPAPEVPRKYQNQISSKFINSL